MRGNGSSNQLAHVQKAGIDAGQKQGEPQQGVNQAFDDAGNLPPRRFEMQEVEQEKEGRQRQEGREGANQLIGQMVQQGAKDAALLHGELHGLTLDFGLAGDDAHEHQGVHGPRAHHANQAKGVLLTPVAALDAGQAGREGQDERGSQRAGGSAGGIKGDGQKLLGHKQA